MKQKILKLAAAFAVAAAAAAYLPVIAPVFDTAAVVEAATTINNSNVTENMTLNDGDTIDNLIVTGGTKDNPVIITINGTVTLNASNDSIHKNLCVANGGSVKIVGGENAVIKVKVGSRPSIGFQYYTGNFDEVVKPAYFTMENIKIVQDTKNSTSAYGLIAAGNGITTFRNVEITEFTAPLKTIIFPAFYCTHTSTSNGNGGSTNTYYPATINLDNVNIHDNSTSQNIVGYQEGNGSGYSTAGPAVINIYGESKIINNKSLGAVVVAAVGKDRSVLNIYNGEISNNTTSTSSTDYRVGGVLVQGVVNIYGGKINNNAGSGNNGGGVTIGSYGTLNMYDGEISGNTSQYSGAGIFCYRGNLNLYGGTITNNETQKNGGGIYNAFNNTCDFNISPKSSYTYTDQNGNSITKTVTDPKVIITGNKAAGVGGGIVFNAESKPLVITGANIDWGDGTTEHVDIDPGSTVYNAGSLRIAGNVQIHDNTSTSNTGDNLFITSSPVFVTGDLEGSNISYSVYNKIDASAVLQEGQVTGNYKLYNPSAGIDTYFHNDMGDSYKQVSGKGLNHSDEEIWAVKNATVASTYTALVNDTNLGYCTDTAHQKTYIIYGFTPESEKQVSDYEYIAFYNKSGDTKIAPNTTDSLPEYINADGDINTVYTSIKFNGDANDILSNATVGKGYIVAIAIDGTAAPDASKFYAKAALLADTQNGQ
ncbi:MAG: hypothetical protein IJ583_17000 [Firmicutes bacterium]|nr:hypothetical protein [Bacillota bacterium]